MNKFNTNHMCLAKTEKSNILNSIDMLLEKCMALDEMGQGCPSNQAEFLYAAHSIISTPTLSVIPGVKDTDFLTT